LRMEMKILRARASMAKVSGTASVDGVVVAEAEMLCVLAERQ